MQLSDYLKKIGKQGTIDLSKKVKAKNYLSLYHIAAGRVEPSLRMAIRIETHSNGEVSLYDLLPDDAIELRGPRQDVN